MLKYGGEKLSSALHKLTSLIIACHAKSPTQFDLPEIIVPFKKGDQLDCCKYRPICLLSHAYKVVMAFLYSRISPDLLRALPVNQAAYQKEEELQNKSKPCSRLSRNLMSLTEAASSASLILRKTRSIKKCYGSV